MDKIELLFVRACKVKQFEKRVYSVYRRFYLGGFKMDKETQDAHLAVILSQIAKKYELIDIYKMAMEVSPEYQYKYLYTKEERKLGSISYTLQLKRVLMSQIRYTNSNVFDGYVIPAFFRNRS